jgi:hypothetical protein
METTYMNKVKTEILTNLIRITESKGIDMNDVEVDRASNYTYYLHNNNILMIVEWKGIKVEITE